MKVLDELIREVLRFWPYLAATGWMVFTMTTFTFLTTESVLEFVHSTNRAAEIVYSVRVSPYPK